MFSTPSCGRYSPLLCFVFFVPLGGVFWGFHHSFFFGTTALLCFSPQAFPPSFCSTILDLRFFQFPPTSGLFRGPLFSLFFFDQVNVTPWNIRSPLFLALSLFFCFRGPQRFFGCRRFLWRVGFSRYWAGPLISSGGVFLVPFVFLGAARFWLLALWVNRDCPAAFYLFFFLPLFFHGTGVPLNALLLFIYIFFLRSLKFPNGSFFCCYLVASTSSFSFFFCPWGGQPLFLLFPSYL